MKRVGQSAPQVGQIVPRSGQFAPKVGQFPPRGDRHHIRREPSDPRSKPSDLLWWRPRDRRELSVPVWWPQQNRSEVPTWSGGRPKIGSTVRRPERRRRDAWSGTTNLTAKPSENEKPLAKIVPAREKENEPHALSGFQGGPRTTIRSSQRLRRSWKAVSSTGRECWEKPRPPARGRLRGERLSAGHQRSFGAPAKSPCLQVLERIRRVPALTTSSICVLASVMEPPRRERGDAFGATVPDLAELPQQRSPSPGDGRVGDGEGARGEVTATATRSPPRPPAPARRGRRCGRTRPSMAPIGGRRPELAQRHDRDLDQHPGEDHRRCDHHDESGQHRPCTRSEQLVGYVPGQRQADDQHHHPPDLGGVEHPDGPMSRSGRTGRMTRARRTSCMTAAGPARRSSPRTGGATPSDEAGPRPRPPGPRRTRAARRPSGLRPITSPGPRAESAVCLRWRMALSLFFFLRLLARKTLVLPICCV